MEPSSNKQKHKLRISLTAMAVIALAAIAFFVLVPKNTANTEEIIIPKEVNNVKVVDIQKDSVSSQEDVVAEEDDIIKDSVRREGKHDFERMREGYGKEQARFAKVLSEASDEELFTVLNYAIANHYVPNRDIDPFYSVGVMVGCWQRTLMVYRNLSDRKDLLKKIYPDLKVLDEYVNWGRYGEPYPNDKVAQTILNNVQQESRKMDSKLISKYFRTPLLDKYE